VPELKPFRAFFYNKERVATDDIVAPPYDVISPLQRDALYQKSQWNVVRLILGMGDDPYNEAARYWKTWRQDKIIHHDEVPGMYLLSQKYPAGHGTFKERTGFIASCRLEELGRETIFPHEKTLAKAREDRFRLISATNAIFSQIFGIYSDPAHYIDRRIEHLLELGPDYSCTFDGILNRLWRITEQNITLDLVTFMKRQRVFIADGHHRYETAVAYSNNRRIRNPEHSGKEAYNFIPMYLTNLHGSGLTILPTHCMICHVPHFSSQDLLKRISEDFAVSAAASVEELLEGLSKKTRQIQFGMILSGDQQFYRVRLQRQLPIAGEGIPAVLAGLDVTVLETCIFKNIMKMTDEDLQEKRYVDYENNAFDAIRAVSEGTAQAAFLIHPPRVEQVKAVAEAGLVMPQKSTYFHPKLLSGLVIYSFEQDENHGL
jgi:uncharacterized protein (DUF1015 family)